MLSAAVLVPVALLCVWLGRWPYLAMLVAGFAGVVWEWGMICRWRPLPLAAGLAYAGAAFASLWLLRQADVVAVLFLLVVVWCSDIGAYVAGRLVGGPRLAPAVSPGKTWAGAVGGLVAAVVGGLLVTRVSAWWAAAAAVLGVASQLGDLGESVMKRHYGVKDSGWLIPGHGGLLDRLDGLMAAAVLVGALALIWAAFAQPEFGAL